MIQIFRFPVAKTPLLSILLLAQNSAMGAENASNPLAAVNNTDTRLQYLKDDAAGVHLTDAYVDGAVMASQKLKIKYELHYVETNISGRSEHDWESAVLKAQYFPMEGVTESGITYRLAGGLDYIYDFDNIDKGIGVGGDQIAPFVGVSLGLNNGWNMIPLVQHYESISGNDISITFARLISIKPLQNRRWLKLDFKLPYDWENETVPSDAEIQYGGYLTESLGLYFDGRFGVGSDRAYDWGVGVGLRFNY